MDAELTLLKSCSRNVTGPLLKTHALVTAPVVTRDALSVCVRDNSVDTFPQMGLLGSVLSVNRRGSLQDPSDPRLYVNLNTPSSGLICGVQVCSVFPKCARGHRTNPIQGIRKKSYLILHSRGVPS
jgi:hypothetical protein